MKKILTMLVMGGLFTFVPGLSQAKNNDVQSQVILLNDSASALEDSNPGLSKSLAEFADEKEREFENAQKAGPALLAPQEQIKLLNTAAAAIKPSYPLIAQGLVKMARAINRTIEIEK